MERNARLFAGGAIYAAHRVGYVDGARGFSRAGGYAPPDFLLAMNASIAPNIRRADAGAAA